MAQRLGIGIQDFEEIRQTNNFYIDKTDFIREWWEANHPVTLITRPRRFGKTLNMSMLNCFFSNKYENRVDLFEGLSIWKNEKFREMQGTYPVISLTFASIKPESYEVFLTKMRRVFSDLYRQHSYLLNSPCLDEAQKTDFLAIRDRKSDDTDLETALHQMSIYLEQHFGKKVIILLDEYDTPMQEAYLNGYWEKAVQFTRGMFGTAFKENTSLERGILTGITRVSKESIFSDFNNLKVVTTTSSQFETAFGFTEKEVFESLDGYGLGEKQTDVKAWYDGFQFGSVHDIYNPWSIINYLQEQKLGLYWANTSSNRLVNKLIQEGSADLKQQMEQLLKGEELKVQMDEQIIFNQLDDNEDAVWSFLVASGYLKIVDTKQDENGEFIYSLQITNHEVHLMFRNMVKNWFQKGRVYNSFVKALLSGDVDEMNEYMNQIAAQSFSSFDTGSHPSEKTQPERFYHGFVLGLLVELQGRYEIKSNRESGFGRYDVALIPIEQADPAIIIEFKVFKPKKENSLEEAVQNALAQIDAKNYDAELLVKGIARDRIRHYGFAFKGKEVFIGE